MKSIFCILGKIKYGQNLLVKSYLYYRLYLYLHQGVICFNLRGNLLAAVLFTYFLGENLNYNLPATKAFLNPTNKYK